jgi:hypothetical protein
MVFALLQLYLTIWYLSAFFLVQRFAYPTIGSVCRVEFATFMCWPRFIFVDLVCYAQPQAYPFPRIFIFLWCQYPSLTCLLIPLNQTTLCRIPPVFFYFIRLSPTIWYVLLLRFSSSYQTHHSTILAIFQIIIFGLTFLSECANGCYDFLQLAYIPLL